MRSRASVIAGCFALVAACTESTPPESRCGDGTLVEVEDDRACVFEAESCPDSDYGVPLKDGRIVCSDDALFTVTLWDELEERGFVASDPSCEVREPADGCFPGYVEPAPAEPWFTWESGELIRFERNDSDDHSDFLALSVNPETLEASATIRSNFRRGAAECGGGEPCEAPKLYEFSVTVEEATSLVDQVSSLAAGQCTLASGDGQCEERLPSAFAIGEHVAYGGCCQEEPYAEYGNDFTATVDLAFNTFRPHAVAGAAFDNPTTFGELEYSRQPADAEAADLRVSVGRILREADGTLTHEFVADCTPVIQAQCWDQNPVTTQTLNMEQQAELEERLGDLKDPVCINGPFSANNGFGSPPTHMLSVDDLERGACYGSFVLGSNIEAIEEFVEWLVQQQSL